MYVWNEFDFRDPLWTTIIPEGPLAISDTSSEAVRGGQPTCIKAVSLVRGKMLIFPVTF